LNYRSGDTSSLQRPYTSDNGRRYIPYRNSLLTMVLRDSLGELSPLDAIEVYKDLALLTSFNLFCLIEIVYLIYIYICSWGY